MNYCSVHVLLMNYTVGSRCFVQNIISNPNSKQWETTGCIIQISPVAGNSFSLIVATDIPINRSPKPVEVAFSQNLGLQDQGKCIMTISSTILGVKVNVSIIKDDLKLNLNPSSIYMCSLRSCNCLIQRQHVLISCSNNHGVCCNHLVPWNKSINCVDDECCAEFTTRLKHYMLSHNIMDDYVSTRALLGYYRYTSSKTSKEKELAVHLAATNSAFECISCKEEYARGNQMLYPSSYGIVQLHYQIFGDDPNPVMPEAGVIPTIDAKKKHSPALVPSLSAPVPPPVAALPPPVAKNPPRAPPNANSSHEFVPNGSILNYCPVTTIQGLYQGGYNYTVMENAVSNLTVEELRALTVERGIYLVGKLQANPAGVLQHTGSFVGAPSNNLSRAGSGIESTSAPSAPAKGNLLKGAVKKIMQQSAVSTSFASRQLVDNTVKQQQQLASNTAQVNSLPVHVTRTATMIPEHNPLQLIAQQSNWKNVSGSANKTIYNPSSTSSSQATNSRNNVTLRLTVCFPAQNKKVEADVVANAGCERLVDTICSSTGCEIYTDDIRIFSTDKNGWCVELVDKGATLNDYKYGFVMHPNDLVEGHVISVRSCKDNVRAKQQLLTLNMKGSIKNNELLKQKIEMMKTRFVGWRPVRGDGNCYYRAVYFSLMEQVIVENRRGVINEVGNLLRNLQFSSTMDKLNHADLMAYVDQAISMFL